MLESNSFPGGAVAIVPPAINPVTGDNVDSLLGKLIHCLVGGSGCEVVANTTNRTYRTLGFTVLTDATFSLATADAGYSATGVTGVLFPAGLNLPFRLSTFTLTSGSVLAIKA